MTLKKYKNIKRQLTVKKTQTGLGLFTELLIEKKGFIIEYIGPVLSYKEANERGGKYLFETSKNRFVDGSTRKNIARYINHSCLPNCKIDILKGHICVFAKHIIKAGEELIYDHDDEYFDAYIKPTGCKCLKCNK